MKILGIDPGLSATGFGLLEAGRYVTHGVIRTRAGADLGPRLKTITDKLRHVLRREKPDSCCVETLFFKKDSARSVIASAHLRGAIFLLMAREGVPVSEITPASVKLAVTGNGRASKQQVSYMVTALLGLDGDVPEDASDALAVAYCAARRAAPPAHDRTAHGPDHR